jgi:hypothetical protein
MLESIFLFQRNKRTKTDISVIFSEGYLFKYSQWFYYRINHNSVHFSFAFSWKTKIYFELAQVCVITELRSGRPRNWSSIPGLGKRFPEEFYLLGYNAVYSVGLLYHLLQVCFLLSLFFDDEDGGNMFLPNVGWLSMVSKALYPRR